MTRQERLVFCKKCKNRDFNLTRGILCKLTGEEAAFEDECPDFLMDVTSNYIPKPKEAIKPNKERAKWAEYLIIVMLIGNLISIFSSYLQYDLILKLQEGFPVSDDQLNSNDLREIIVGIAAFLIYIISTITFIRWFRRAYFNLNSRTKVRFDEGWAAGSWFVPILNLFRPYQIMSELDEETSILIEKRSSKPIKRNGGLIGFWWALWILGGIVARYVFKNTMRAESLEELLSSTQIEMYSSLVDFPLAIAAILVIRAVSKKEELLSELEDKDGIKNTDESL